VKNVPYPQRRERGPGDMMTPRLHVRDLLVLRNEMKIARWMSIILPHPAHLMGLVVVVVNSRSKAKQRPNARKEAD